MKNPFRYGEVVKGEDFADREKELEGLIKDLKAAHRQKEKQELYRSV